MQQQYRPQFKNISCTRSDDDDYYWIQLPHRCPNAFDVSILGNDAGFNTNGPEPAQEIGTCIDLQIIIIK